MYLQDLFRAESGLLHDLKVDMVQLDAVQARHMVQLLSVL